MIVGAIACILVFLVWVLVFVYENFNAFTSGIGKVKFISPFLKTIVFYFIVAGFWHNDNELKKEVFWDKDYLELREQFQKASSGVTNKGMVNADGVLMQIVERRNTLLKKFRQIKEDNIKWKVFYCDNTSDKKVYFREDVYVSWGWKFPPFPWMLKSYLEYPPYSKER